mgnify:CR=1 FL=1
MPFSKTHEVPEAFFNIFLKEAVEKLIQGDNRKHPMVSVPLHTGGSEDFMVRYYNRSGESSIEDVMEYYPCIVIQDFQPELDKRLLYGKDYVEGYLDKVSGTRELITLPIPLMYRFQVSVVTRRLKEIQSANDWFFNKFSFQRPDCFEFNIIETEEGKVGDVVPYNANFGQVPREDNRFEYSYDFVLNTFVHAKYKNYSVTEDGSTTGGNFEDVLERLVLTLTVQDYEQFRMTIVDNFEPIYDVPGEVVIDTSNNYSDNWSDIKW